MENKIYILPLLTLITFFSCNQTETSVEVHTESTESFTEAEDSTRLDTTLFEIMDTKHYPTTENYYVLLKTNITDTDSLQVFVNNFRKEFCKKQCNIKLYDDESVKPYVTMYPIPDDMYLIVADHFVADSDFSTRKVYHYPFQDIHYKELGGKNWKRTPIE